MLTETSMVGQPDAGSQKLKKYFFASYPHLFGGHQCESANIVQERCRNVKLTRNAYVPLSEECSDLYLRWPTSLNGMLLKCEQQSWYSL
jgi:hypothetical protein